MWGRGRRLILAVCTRRGPKRDAAAKHIANGFTNPDCVANGITNGIANTNTDAYTDTNACRERNERESYDADLHCEWRE